MNENLEFQTIQNPYYDNNIEMSDLSENMNLRSNSNYVDAITATTNIYYDL